MSLVQNIKKTINYSRKNGYKEAFCAAWERVTAKYYADYTYNSPLKEVLEAQRRDKNIIDIKFSIIVPAYETQKNYLTALIDSCVGQTYSNWELVIADGSRTDIVKETVSGYNDNRIIYIKLEENGGIADNTNKAIEHATGQYCGLLDHDDMLTPDALYEMVKMIGDKYIENGIMPTLVYSDEDKCDTTGTKFYDPHFKLDFNLDLLLTNNYICHFMAVETQTLKRLQIRKEYDGSQDFDLILRVVSSLLLKEKEGQSAIGTNYMEKSIAHVPKILYHWRCHENSTADNPQSKMYAYEAGKKALIDFTKRMGWKADIRHNKHLGFYRIMYRNNVLSHRPDLAAVGGFVVKHGKVSSGIYKGQPLFYAGYMNRMDLYQNIELLDIRNLEINKEYQHLYKKVTGHNYENTFATEQNELPEWIKELEKQSDGKEKIEKINRRLSKLLISQGGRLLLDPECVRRI